MTTITRALVENGYEITQEQVRELAETRLASGEVDKSLTEGYFKVLLKRTQQHILSQSTEGRLQALDKADETMYPIVITVINEQDDCKPNHNDSADTKKAKAKLRNERSNYARSAKSVIRKAIICGITIEHLNASVTGKTAVEKMATAALAEIADGSPPDYLGLAMGFWAQALKMACHLSSEDKAQFLAHVSECIK